MTIELSWKLMFEIALFVLLVAIAVLLAPWVPKLIEHAMSIVR
ncbi:MAG: hypothetical protein QW751_01595 [Candidatus Aenigmatarchaeota archaeon]